MDYKAFPFYMGYQGYGQWTPPGYIPEDRVLEDLEYLQQMYPTYAKKYQGVIRNVVDKMDYEGSFIYDQYPDKITLQRMVTSVMAIIKTTEEKENRAVQTNGMRNPREGMSGRPEMPNRTFIQNDKMGAERVPIMGNPSMGEIDQNMPNGSMPNGGMPNANMPNGNMPNANMPNGNMPNANMPNTNMSNGNMPNMSMPNGNMSNSGVPNMSMPDAGMFEQNITSSNVTENTLTERAPWNEKEPWIRELVTVLIYYEILARRKRRQKKYWNI